MPECNWRSHEKTLLHVIITIKLRRIEILIGLMLLLPQSVVADTTYDAGVYQHPSAQVEVETSKEYTNEDIPQLLINEFGQDHIMTRVAYCESTHRHFGADGQVLRGEVNSDDVGVFQINTYYHGETAKELNLDLTQPIDNIAYAIYLYNKNGLEDWKYSKSCWQTV